MATWILYPFNTMLQTLKIFLIKCLLPGKGKRKVALSSLSVRQPIPKLKDFLSLFIHKFRAGSALRSSLCILRWMQRLRLTLSQLQWYMLASRLVVLFGQFGEPLGGRVSLEEQPGPTCSFRASWELMWSASFLTHKAFPASCNNLPVMMDSMLIEL